MQGIIVIVVALGCLSILWSAQATHPSCSRDGEKLEISHSQVELCSNISYRRFGNHKVWKKVQNQEENATRAQTFQKVSHPIPWGAPVEVVLLGSLPLGVGDQLISLMKTLQFNHPEYVMAYYEASAKVLNTQFELGDATAVYTFLVDTEDLVFHRHEGHRAILGITGSGGAYLKFSSVDHIDAKTNPQTFIDGMFIVELPADSLFILRFTGRVYHQFGPVIPTSSAFFAISVHTDESGGDLSPELLEKVLAGEGNIPLLTEPLPDPVISLLQEPGVMDHVKRYSLPRVELNLGNQGLL